MTWEIIQIRFHPLEKGKVADCLRSRQCSYSAVWRAASSIKSQLFRLRRFYIRGKQSFSLCLVVFQRLIGSFAAVDSHTNTVRWYVTENISERVEREGRDGKDLCRFRNKQYQLDTVHFSLYWGSQSRHVSGITCPSSGGTTQTQGWWLLCSVVDVGWSQDVGRRHGCLSVVSVVCCQVEVSATCWSLVQRSPTDCGASCVTSWVRRP
jgi:hypothetical protein